MDNAVEQARLAVRAFNTAGLAFLGVATALLTISICILGSYHSDNHGKVTVLFIIATGAFIAGGFIGFLHGMFGTEAERFKNITGIMNGLIGGFAISDLSKNEGIIKQALHSLANAAGPGVGSGLVATVALSFGAVGFLLCYINKTMVLNPVNELLDPKARQAVNNAADAKLEERTKGKVDESQATPKAEQPASSEVQDAAKKVVMNKRLMDDPSAEACKTRGKALYVKDQKVGAEKEFQQALALNPDDVEALSYLGEIRIDLDRPVDAIEPLEKLKVLAPDNDRVLKLLGYSYLWMPEKLDQSIAETTAFLEKHPQELGAKLNLACAHAQKGISETSKKIVLPILRELIEKKPDRYRPFLKKLAGPGGDFHAWREDTEFKQILGL